MFRHTLPVLACFACLTTALLAQESSSSRWITTLEERALSGLRAVLIALESSDSPEKCIVRREDLRLTAARSLMDGGVKVEEKADPMLPALHIGLGTLSPERACIGSLTVRLQAHGLAAITHQQTTRIGALLNGAEHSVLISPVATVFSAAEQLYSDHPAEFQATTVAHLKRMTDRIVTQIKLANQPKE